MMRGCFNKINFILLTRIVVTLSIITFPYTTSTMVLTPKVMSLSFRDYNFNEIRVFGDSLINIQLSELGKAVCNSHQKITIAHIGDSHIQADIFTGEVRKLLSTYFNEAAISKGFCFPYSLIGSNNPENLTCKSSATWDFFRIKGSVDRSETGVSGAAIQTNDSLAQIKLELNSGSLQNYQFDIVRVYFEDDSLNFKPFLNESITKKITKKGSTTFYLSEARSSIVLQIRKTNPNQQIFRLYGIELLNSESKMYYHSIGINGADVRSYLTSRNFEAQIKELNPNVVVLSLGTNDGYNPTFNPTQFLESYCSFINKVQGVIPNSIIILTTPGDHLLLNGESNPNIKSVCEQIYSIAKIKHCLVWDFHSIMNGAGGIKEWANQGLYAPDYLHLSKQGYRLQGGLFYNALVKIFETNNID